MVWVFFLLSLLFSPVARYSCSSLVQTELKAERGVEVLSTVSVTKYTGSAAPLPKRLIPLVVCVPGFQDEISLYINEIIFTDVSGLAACKAMLCIACSYEACVGVFPGCQHTTPLPLLCFSSHSAGWMWACAEDWAILILPFLMNGLVILIEQVGSVALWEAEARGCFHRWWGRTCSHKAHWCLYGAAPSPCCSPASLCSSPRETECNYQG